MLDQVSSGTYQTKSDTAWCKLSNSFRVGEAESAGPAWVHFWASRQEMRGNSQLTKRNGALTPVHSI
jgi:hypothetical protein